jgi:hypothetical protein
MRWVTRQSVGPDRVACAWLIQGRIDPRAPIEYLAEEAIAEAVHAGALPFHTTTAEQAAWEERTTFRQLLAEYKLDQRDPALVRLAGLVRRAEQGAGAAHPEAARLAASIKRLQAERLSDEEVVAQLRPVMDALYVACRAAPR